MPRKSGRKSSPPKLTMTLVVLLVVVGGLGLLYFWFVSPPAPKIPKPPPAPPPIKEILVPKAKLVIVMDDLGDKLEAVEFLTQLDPQLTLAIIPQLAYSRQSAQLAYAHDQEVLVHLPLEPHHYERYGPLPQMLLMKMPAGEIQERLQRALDSFPGAVGVNNHMGSRMTEDPQKMQLILLELKQRGLIFLDSRTSGNSVAYRLAKELGLTTFQRDIFLDNENNSPAVLKQLDKLAERAEKHGQAIGICHPKPATLTALRQFLGQLDRDRFDLTRLSELPFPGVPKQP